VTLREILGRFSYIAAKLHILYRITYVYIYIYIYIYIYSCGMLVVDIRQSVCYCVNICT
jgi:hypothetical protein